MATGLGSSTAVRSVRPAADSPSVQSRLVPRSDQLRPASAAVSRASARTLEARALADAPCTPTRSRREQRSSKGLTCRSVELAHPKSVSLAAPVLAKVTTLTQRLSKVIVCRTRNVRPTPEPPVLGSPRSLLAARGSYAYATDRHHWDTRLRGRNSPCGSLRHCLLAS
jgi:hypothetical protein